MIEDDDGASSSAYAELERLERETAVARSQHSTSSTVTAISVPPATAPSYRVPSPSSISTSEPPVPQAIQAFKESANMVAAFNMQWKDEISAMRYELAELRRDVCGELKTFNSNFFNFTQCYNMWTLCREPCSDSTTQTDDRVSIGIQAGSSWSIRHHTEDKSVMCQPEPARFSIMDLMNPPRIEIIEGTPESTPEGSGSPASLLPIEDFPWEINKKQKTYKQPDLGAHTGHRSASLELWSRKYTSGPMSYLSMSFWSLPLCVWCEKKWGSQRKKNPILRQKARAVLLLKVTLFSRDAESDVPLTGYFYCLSNCLSVLFSYCKWTLLKPKWGWSGAFGRV